MLSSCFAIALKEIYESKLKPNDVIKILTCLTVDSSNLKTENLPMDVISMYIHHLFIANSPLLRTELLKIVLNLETNSDETILEKYHFDKLTAISLEQKSVDVTSKLDEEKAICFSIVSVMIKIRNYLPNSIIRALISLYYQPKHSYKTLILSYLVQVIEFFDNENLPIVNEISRILVENIGEGNLKFVPYICHTAEKFIRENEKVGASFFLNYLLEPIFQNHLEQPALALVKILRTWSGLLYYGIERHMINNILLYMHSSPSTSISIIKDLLMFDVIQTIESTHPTILDGYSGYLLSYLLSIGLVDSLSALQNQQDPVIVKFLDEIVRYTGIKMETSRVLKNVSSNISPSSSAPIAIDFNNNKKSEQMYSLLNIFSVQCCKKDLSSFVQDDDPLLWDWKLVYMSLVRVLPFDEELSMHTEARTLYTKLLDFFSSHFLTVTGPSLSLIRNCFISFFEFLLPRDYGFPVIACYDEIKKMILLSIHNVSNNPNIDLQSTIFFVFTFIIDLISTNEGAKLFTQWEILDSLYSVGTKCQSIEVTKIILQKISFSPVSTLTVPLFSKFLLSNNPQIMRLSIEYLRSKQKTTPMFHVSGFLKLLVPHIKNMDQQLQNQATEKDKLLEENMWLSLNLMCEFMQNDEHCLIDVAGDAQIHNILKRRSHFIYSMLLSREETLSLANVEEEIQWWMSEGNEKYLTIYDKAVECAFEQQYNSAEMPEITSSLLPPPHLFGQLSKAPTGQQKLSTYIPQLIEQCKSEHKKVKKAAFFALAHFASSAPEPFVSAFNIANLLISCAISSPSLQIRGTLISCLSLFQHTNYLSECLQKCNWQVFSYGSRSCVIPCDPLILSKPLKAANNAKNNEILSKRVKNNNQMSESNVKTEELKDNKSNPYYSFIIQLNDPITMKQGKAELVQAYREKQSSILTPETSLMASSLISNYSFSQDNRSFILGLFRSTPLVPLAPPQVDELKLAECKVKIYEALQSGAPKGLDQVNWLKYAPEELTRHKYCKEFPELYLRDDIMEKTIGMPKKDFYLLSEAKRKEIREQILSKK